MHPFNRKSLAVLAIALSGLGAFGQAQAAAPAPASPKDMFVENESPRGYAETVEALKAELTAAGWTILAGHELHAALAKKGHTVEPVTILEACSGKFSVALLKKDETRYVSSMMPCRVSIYRTSSGKTIISRLNNAAMAGMMEPAVAEVMNKASEEMEKHIATVLGKK